jgi:hypothetical protein
MRFRFTPLIVASLCVSGQSLPPVPDQLKPPGAEKLTLQARASGDQVYTCDGSGWILSGPDAKLFDEGGKQVGSHFAGPTWEWSDGSRVTGRPVADSTPDPDSIPWLLLIATDHAGNGAMTQVSSIQRLSTKGGKPPTAGCDESHKGTIVRSHYTAAYYFYTRSCRGGAVGRQIATRSRAPRVCTTAGAPEIIAELAATMKAHMTESDYRGLQQRRALRDSNALIDVANRPVSPQ